jgi:hypothetical protein
MIADYVIEQNLKLAFEETDSPQDSTSTLAESVDNGAITPAVKQAVAGEVKSHVAEMELEAKTLGSDSKPAQDNPEQSPPVLNSRHRLVTISSTYQVTTTSGEVCSLTGGDIIVRTGDEIVDGDKVAVSVLASRPGDCPFNVPINVNIADLQEQYTEMRTQIHSGINLVANNQGSKGMPKGPTTNMRATSGAAIMSDADAQNELLKAFQEADQGEAEVKSSIASVHGT